MAEATLTSWLKEVGDPVEMDEAVFEIATDKVDSEVPSEVEGILVKKLFEVDDVIKVGQAVAVIELNGSETSRNEAGAEPAGDPGKHTPSRASENLEAEMQQAQKTVSSVKAPIPESSRFYSPLVKNIAREEGISTTELDGITGSGKDGRVTKNDILAYLENRKKDGVEKSRVPEASGPGPEKQAAIQAGPGTGSSVQTRQSIAEERIPMTRMGRLIAQHMADSVATSAHVQSFVEVDVTNVVAWRERVKEAFEKREGEKLTYTPIFLEAVAKALKKFPMMNISVDGDAIIKRKHINIGMAAALPDGNLIVPVIRNADQLNLVGMARAVNDLADRARTNNLKPDEVKEGTYTVTNVGSFGSVFGTPIINQPQVGILALGAIRKVPAVIETADGDFIGIRSKMFLSHSYDHRVVNGALGGMFAKAVADYLEAWDVNRDF